MAFLHFPAGTSPSRRWDRGCFGLEPLRLNQGAPGEVGRITASPRCPRPNPWYLWPCHLTGQKGLGDVTEVKVGERSRSPGKAPCPPESLQAALPVFLLLQRPLGWDLAA